MYIYCIRLQINKHVCLSVCLSVCLRVESLNHLHTEFSLGYLKDTTIFLESKASFIDIGRFASFQPFLIACL